MLDDLKSFFATSSVAEVGVGVTLGAAFAALIGAITASVQSVLSGDPDLSGLWPALITLLAVALLSVFGVVKPLAGLKKRLGQVQAAKVAEAVSQARSGDLQGAAATAGAQARAAGLLGGGGEGPGEGTGAAVAGAPVSADSTTGATSATGTDDQPAADSDAAAALGTDDVPASAAAAGPADPELGGGDPAQPVLSGADGTAGAVVASGATDETDAQVAVEEGSALLPADAAGDPAQLDAAGGSGAPGDGDRPDPLTAPLSTLSAVDAGASSDAALAGADGRPTATSTSTSTPGVPAGPAAGAPAVLPHSAAGGTKPCPFCAFDIPAVATRCGWCTSDLGDLRRAEHDVAVAPG